MYDFKCILDICWNTDYKEIIKMNKHITKTAIEAFFVIIFFIFIGYLYGHSSVKTIEKEKLVSPCDKAFGASEKEMCIAKDVCNGKLKDFRHDSLRVETVFNCGE
jgi:hypothetical protein